MTCSSPPRAHFLQIRLKLLEKRVPRRDRDDGHLAIDQRERPVLELARSVGLRMDVRDLLQFERAFHGDRVVDAAAEKEGMPVAREPAAPGCHRGLQAEHAADGGRKVAQ